MTEQELQESVIDLFGDLTFATDALLAYASESIAVNYPAYMNLRDALMHLRDAIGHPAGDISGEQFAQMVCAGEHIRRAAVEPLQELFQRRYDAVEMRYRQFRNRSKETAFGYLGIRNALTKQRKALKQYRLGKNGKNWRQIADEMFFRCVELRELDERLAQLESEYDADTDD